MKGGENAVAWVLGGVAVLIVAPLFFLAAWEGIAKRHSQQAACEARGGVTIEHTYTVGKVSGQTLTCFAKDSIIQN